MSNMQAMLQRMARQQGRDLTQEEDNLMKAASQPTQTQLMIQQLTQPAPQPMPQEPPMQMAAAPDPFGGVSAQTRNAMHQMGKADPTGEMGDMMIGRQAAPQGFKAKTTVRGAQSPAQEEQLVKMLKGRGMSEEEARARVKGL